MRRIAATLIQSVFCFVAVGAMAGANAAIARGDGCVNCQSTKQTRPTLQIRFTACCGTPYCTECVTTKTRVTKTWKCAQCITFVSAKDFSADPLEVQKYRREAAVRIEVNKVYTPPPPLTRLLALGPRVPTPVRAACRGVRSRFNGRRQDFGPDNDEAALQRYNDYLEKAQDFGL